MKKNSWESSLLKEEVLSEGREVKVVEEGLQHQEMELAAAHLKMHPQKVMQEAEGVPTEEEEVEKNEEKWGVIDVISLDIELMNVQQMWGQIKEM